MPNVNPGIQAAGNAAGAAYRNPSSGASSIGGLTAGSSFDVDTKGLSDLSSKIRLVTTDIGSLISQLDKLEKKATSVGTAFEKAFSKTSGGAGGSKTTTAAPVTGGPQQQMGIGATRALTLGAVGEIGSSWAGSINSGMQKMQAGGMPIDLMTRQANAIFGNGQTVAGGGVNTSGYTNISNMGQADLGSATAQLQANPLLFSALGGRKQTGVANFMNQMQKLNPLMGAAGAAQFANTLTSGSALQQIQRYSGVSGGALLRPMNVSNPGGINNPTQVMRTLLKTVTGNAPGLTGNANQMKRMSGSSSGAAADWAMINQNFGQGTAMNLSPQELTALRQFAAAGGNLQQADKNVGGSVAGSALSRSTATTATKQNVFESTTDVQNWTNDFMTGVQKFSGLMAKTNPLLLSFGVILAGITAGGLGIGAKALEAKALLTGVKGVLGGGGGVAGAGAGAAGGLIGQGLSALTGSSSGGGTPNATAIVALTNPAPSGTRNFSFANDNSLFVSLSPTSIQDLGRTIAADAPKAGTSKKKTTSPASSGGSGGSGFWGAIGSAIAGAGYSIYKDVIKNNPGTKTGPGGKPEVGGTGAGGADPIEPPIGDPITGSTTTQGMTPALAKRVSAMQAANPNVKITSGHRTAAQQANLYNLKGGVNVAKPGQSAHQKGQAADVGPPSQFGWIAKNANKFGLGRPAPTTEPWHLQVMGDPANTGSSVTGASVVQKAEAWIGTPYVYGGQGTSPGQGVDCSRFVQEVFASVGVSLPRTTWDQMNVGTTISTIAAAQPGDLIFYGGGEHVTIYIGNGQLIHAPETGETVRIQAVWTGITTIKRVVGGGAGAAAAATATAAAGGSSTTTPTSSGSNVGLANTFAAGISGNTALGGGSGVSSGTGQGAISATTKTASGSAPPSASAAPATGGSASVVAAVKKVASDKNVQIAMLMGSYLESNQNPTDNGQNVAYGAFMIEPSQNPVTIAQAEDVNFAAKYMEPMYAAGVAQEWGSNNPKQITEQAAGNAAHDAERPAQSYFASQPTRVGPAYSLAVSEVGDPVGSPSAFTPIVPAGSSIPSSVPMAGAASGPSSAPIGARVGGGRGITLHMPIQVVGSATQQDAQNLVQMVYQLMQQHEENDRLANN
jgi:cell wall-associated NlpC family hydrolase